MPRPFLIDTDTASDDAVALILALRTPGIDVKAITTVAGNVPVEQGTRNALFVTELCGADVPVYTGAPRPLWREFVTAEWFHGKDGLGDRGYQPAKAVARSKHAVDAIIETIRAHPGLELVTLGPLTNIALAVSRDPSIVAQVSRCVVMGGNPCCEGNVTPAAEYNIWVDPDAARIVFRSGLPIELVGWHLCRGCAALNESDIEHVLSLNTPAAEFSIECNRPAMNAYLNQTGEVGISLPDPVAMAIAIDPSICPDASEHWIEIETSSELTRGMTVVDRLNVAADDRNRDVWAPLLNRSKPRIYWTLDCDRWKQMLYAALKLKS